MPFDGKRKAKELNGREIMELWAKMGSLGRVHKYYQSSGKVNPRTLQPYDQSSLWRAASIYLIEQPKEAREIYRAEGDVKTDKEWDLFVLDRAIQIYRTQRSTFIRWVNAHEWAKEYEYLYRDEFAVRPEDYDYFAKTNRRGRKQTEFYSDPVQE